MKLKFETDEKKDYMGRYKWFAIGEKGECDGCFPVKYVIFTTDKVKFKLSCHWTFSYVKNPVFNSLDEAIQAANEIEEIGAVEAMKLYAEEIAIFNAELKKTVEERNKFNERKWI